MSLQLTIDKLKYGESYYVWAAAVRAYLRTEGLWKIVKKGVDTQNEESLRADNRAKYIIYSLIDRNVDMVINTAWRAKNLWEFLESFGPGLPSGRRELKKQMEDQRLSATSKWLFIIAVNIFIFMLMMEIVVKWIL